MEPIASAKSGVRIVEIVVSPERFHAGNVKDALRPVRAVPGSVVVFDLTAAIAIDSTALGEIVRIHRRLLASGGGVVLAGPSKGIQRVLSLTWLDKLLVIFNDLDAAVMASQAGASPAPAGK